MSEIHIYDILRRPIITEKTDYQSDVLGQYSFEVDKRATKQQIKEAVEVVFDVEVTKVRTMIMPAKQGRRLRKTVTRRKEWKKAIVTLGPGQEIDLFNV
jgi:large subunit ribosomal protein L23